MNCFDTNTPEEELKTNKCIWSEICFEIRMKLCSGEGLKIPKIGTFSFCALDDHELGYSKRIKKTPCFFLSGWLCHQCDIQQVRCLVSSTITPKTLNMLTVADNLVLERTKVENFLKRLCLTLQRDITTKKSAVLDFTKIGRLRIIGNVASFKFFREFVRQLDGQANEPEADYQMSGESSVLSASTTTMFPSLCNESQLDTFSTDYAYPSKNFDVCSAPSPGKAHSLESQLQTDNLEHTCAKVDERLPLQHAEETWESKKRTCEAKKDESGSQSTAGRTSLANKIAVLDSTTETLSCGHSRAAGQELCYLCHQKVAPINQKDAVLDARPNAPVALSQDSECHFEIQTTASDHGSTRSTLRQKHHILYPMGCYIDRNRVKTPTKESRQAAFKAQLDQHMELHLAARDAMKDYLCQLESLEVEAASQDLNKISLKKNQEKLEKQADYKAALEYQIDLGSTSSSIY